MKFTRFSAVLFSIWMSVVVTGDARPGTCCLTVTNTRVPVENIVKYEMQDSTAICAIRAVRFHTKRSITICSDPDSKWAKKVMDIVDGRTTAKPTMCYTSTTNTIPTVTTTNKTPGTQTETSKSTTVSRIVTTIETSRPETETSKSTTSSQIVTTIETSRPQTETSKTTNQPTSVPKENPESLLSTVTTCGKGGATSPSTETRRKTPGIGTAAHLNTLKTTGNTGTTSRVINKTLPRTTKLSKLVIRKRGKSKNRLRTFQMGRHVKNKPGKN